MFRHWRIQVTLICFTLLLAVIVFWVRSYSWDDAVTWTYRGANYLRAVSINGDVYFGRMILPSSPTKRDQSWEMFSSQLGPNLKNDLWSHLKTKSRIEFLGFHVFVSDKLNFVSMPYWFISIFLALLCGLPWYWRRFNFSLRTFLIAFTVLAVLLGLIGWLTRLPVTK